MRPTILCALIAMVTSAFSQVALFDSHQKVKLVFDRKTVDGNIVVREQWDQPTAQRVLETKGSESGLVSKRVFSLARLSGKATTSATIDTHGARVVTTTS